MCVCEAETCYLLQMVIKGKVSKLGNIQDALLMLDIGDAEAG